LRRLCPRRLDFAALVLGSLSPDLGYAFGPQRLGAFSHRPLAGVFGFCLPVGLALLWLFHSVRLRAIARLPLRQRELLQPLCRRRASGPVVIAVSLLLGAWTHIVLDSITHRNGWLATRVAFLQLGFPSPDSHTRVCDWLYSACTFGGVACVAWSYVNWVQRVAGTRGWARPAFRWASSLTLAALALLLSFANQGPQPRFGIVWIGLLTGLMAAGFFVGTGWALTRRSRAPTQSPPPESGGADPARLMIRAIKSPPPGQSPV
jgi:hypothetical protein